MRSVSFSVGYDGRCVVFGSFVVRHVERQVVSTAVGKLVRKSESAEVLAMGRGGACVYGLP